MSRPRVVIIGGGFGGLEAARGLQDAAVDVTIVDRQNHHLFQPLLYQVATAGLSAPDIAAPIRKVLRRQPNATVLLGDVRSIDTAGRRVILSPGDLPYDYLILCAGATVSYFGHDAWSAHAPGLKTLDDALAIRRKVLLAFEAAERETDPARQAEWLTFVVIGGGPTGVELAGAIAEIAFHTLARDFRRFDPRKSRVILLEGGPRILPPFPEDLAAKAARQLESLGVVVRCRAMVTSLDATGVDLGAERVACRTILWAAGVKASALGATLGAPLDRSGRVIVAPDLSVPGHPEVFVAGDLAAFTQDGKPVPGVAPAAMQMGRHAARAVECRLRGESPPPFRYVDKGSLATIGRSAGVADFGRVKLSGFPAWLAWLLIHVFFLIGFRNRIVCIIDWAWAYLTLQRSARIVLAEPEPREPYSG